MDPKGSRTPTVTELSHGTPLQKLPKKHYLLRVPPRHFVRSHFINYTALLLIPHSHFPTYLIHSPFTQLPHSLSPYRARLT